MLTSFFHWLAQSVLALGYPGIVVLMAIESSVLPLPSEFVMPPAGYLAAKGQMNAWVAVVAKRPAKVIRARRPSSGAEGSGRTSKPPAAMSKSISASW